MTDLVGIDLGGANCAIVQQERLVLAGSQTIPDLVLASELRNTTNFRTHQGPNDLRGNPTALATDAFWFEQSSGLQNTFHAFLQQQGLLLLGDLGESTIPGNEPFTPEGVSIRANSTYGSDIGQTAVIASGLVIFIQSGGNDVRGFNWSEQEAKYVAPSLLRRAGSVVQDAVDMVLIPSRGRSADLVYVILDNGSMAVLALKSEEGAFAWSRWDTGDRDDRILSAAAPLGEQVFLVERNGVIGVETLDHDAWGRRLQQESDPPVDGLTYNQNRNDRDGSTNGRPYTRTLQSLPFVARSQSGTRRGVQKSRMLRVEVDLAFGFHRQFMPAFTMQVGPDGRERNLPMIPFRGQSEDSRGLQQIQSYRIGSTSGWKKRLGIQLDFTDHIEIAGLSYLATG